MDERIDAIYIGSIIGGRNDRNKGWIVAIDDIGEKVKQACVGVDVSPRLDIVFHISGHMLRPDYHGVRTGSYSKKMDLLMIQVALPEDAAEDAYGFLKEMIFQCISEASAWAVRKKKCFDKELLLGRLRGI